MGILDMILGATGTPDPEQGMEEWSRQQSAKNRAAIDPNNPMPGTSPATTTPPGQVPNNAKSDPDMGALIGQLSRREQANQGFNQALGMGFGAFAQPRDREAVDRMFNVQPLDATKLGESIMAANSNQQGQDRSNALGNMINGPQGPSIAAALHMPGANPAEQLAALKAAYAANPQSVGAMITQTQQPTPQMANLEQINNYVAQLGQSDPTKTQPVLTMIKNAMIAGMGGPEAQAAIGDAVSYKNRTGKDAPWVKGGAIDQGAYKQFQADESQKQLDRGNAAHTLAENENAANELRTGLESIRDNPALKGMLDNPVKRALVQSVMKDPDATDVPSIIKKYALSTDEAQVIATIRRITGQSTANALHSLVGTGTRVTQQEVGPLKDAISTVLNFNQDYDNYVHNSVNPFITKIKKAVANTYGASGNLAHMDPELEPWLHPIYRKGSSGGPAGELYKEGSGADAIPDLGPAPQEKIDEAKRIIADHPFMKEDILDNMQQQGFDVGKYRHLDPSKW